MIAAALIVLGVSNVVLAALFERAQERHAAERKHLLNVAIARHVGEIRTLESAPTTLTTDRAVVSIEGLT
jgi:membrane protein implicated in regulation of membrane protease activity